VSDAIRPVLQVQWKDYFDICSRAKRIALRFVSCAYFWAIVDFTVADKLQDVIRGRNRLFTTFDVYDAQAAVTESNTITRKKTFSIRASMRQRRRHSSDGLKVSVRNYPGNSTHV